MMKNEIKRKKSPGHSAKPRGKKNGSSSQYVGVCYVSKNIRYPEAVGKWSSSLTVGQTKTGKGVNLGYFDTEREAALARDKKIISLGLDLPLQILKRK